MIVLPLAFITGVILILLLFKRKIPGTSVSLPFPATVPTPTIYFSEPIPTTIPQISELENDLLLIEEDIKKLKREDNRLNPPSFIFELGLD